MAKGDQSKREPSRGDEQQNVIQGQSVYPHAYQFWTIFAII